MSDMRCGNCGRYGIAWVGDLLNPSGTKCPHCGGRNCQEVSANYDEEDEDDGADDCCPGCGACPGFIGAECEGDCDHARAQEQGQ